MPKRVVITGGAGFIGSALIRLLINDTDSVVLNIDKLTYAGNAASLAEVAKNPRYSFEKIDICDQTKIHKAIDDFRPNLLIHLAAESHVDRSIDGPSAFIETNIVGVYVLLQVSLAYWRSANADVRPNFRFHHVSTDEVFGSLNGSGAFDEETRYDPSSPYAASKAAADHLVRAWNRTYGLPSIVSNCSNNYGPFQFPEKLIPLTILKALKGEPLPVYGRGENVRDWLHVEDHARALWTIAQTGRVGSTYLVGGRAERRNIDVVRQICRILDELYPEGSPRERLISFVDDRPGHDLMYAIDPSCTERELDWKPVESFESGLRKTVIWYLEHRDWWAPLANAVYQGQRLGLAV